MNTSYVTTELKESMLRKLKFLYRDEADDTFEKIASLIERYKETEDIEPKKWISEDDVMLITYGDSIIEKDQKPLQTLNDFLKNYVKDTLSSVHILPFYPYSSDDGFSVIDYRQVNEDLGDWSDINRIANHYDLMFDAVVNHISKLSEWFQGYLRGKDKYKDYFIEANPEEDYSQVVRPRALPLLTPFEVNGETKHIWTTFSDDQIDINFKNPEVLLEVIDIMAMYAKNGARYIRLDAIGFIWKALGTSCMHLEETHTLVKLIRETLNAIAPGIILITETNVPHEENISYFGNGSDEAQMVYQFPLPPLTLFSFHSQNARKLSEWADSLESTTDSTSFFNFLSSHDGVGMRPTEGILTDTEKNMMVEKVTEHGGLVSYKNNADGSRSPYELNINYLDALTHPDEDDEVRVKRFMAAHTILLSVVGVPGVYVHSLLGSQNDYEGARESGINRRINREKLNKDVLYKALDTEGTLRSKVFGGLTDLINMRKTQTAFSPVASQKVLFLDDRVFSIVRENAETDEAILVLVNVSGATVQIDTDYSGIDLISGDDIDQKVSLEPYQKMWIKL